MQGESYRHGNSKKGASFCHKGQTGKEMTSLISSQIQVPFFFLSSIQVALATSWEVDGETVETVSVFILGGSKITADGDFSHEIKKDAYSLEEK